ncbi:MAG: site-2 protease family protein [Candidatus Komeilibacteria bacterium]|nr:site-2 protease family protein [Candidatus Komeilibacteria bacterium]
MSVTIIVFILILSLLIFVHESGHFLTARQAGIKVEEFGFGFPPRIWGKKKGGTIYSLNWIPLGGFVKIKGENGEDRQDPDSFGHQGFWVKSLVLAAGVLMNVVLAFILLSFGFMFGLPQALDNSDLNQPYVKDVKVQIIAVVKDSPAEQAGIKANDQIVSLGRQEVKNQDQVLTYIKEHQSEAIALSVTEEGRLKEFSVKPAEVSGYPGGKALGLNIVQVGLVKYGFWASWYHGAIVTGLLLVKIILAFYGLLKNLIMGAGVAADLSGPVGVAVLTGQVVGLGFAYVIQFAAMLSLNLAVINFFPFPALDGGRFLFLVIEKIRRKPNNQKIENLIHNLGFSLLMLLVVFITYRDLLHYGGGIITAVKGWF